MLHCKDTHFFSTSKTSFTLLYNLIEIHKKTWGRQPFQENRQQCQEIANEPSTAPDNHTLYLNTEAGWHIMCQPVPA